MSAAGGRAHLIGIGGAGMAPVAQLLAARGWRVTGSDARAGAALEHLRSLGITAHVGHARQQVPPGATVVVSSAVRSDNPELVRARELGLEVIHRSAALVLAAAGQDFVAVAGAHGKTTTSAMLAVALRGSGCDPSYAIGGRVADLDGSAHLGRGTMFVAEADESDGSFLAYRSRVGVVTSIEPDHLDHYGSRSAFEQAFRDFAANVAPDGLLVCCADDSGSASLASQRAAHQRVITYGTGPTGPPGVTEHVEIAERDVGGGRSGAVLRRGGRHVLLELAVGGAHNLLNAAAAWCAGTELGAPDERLAAALGDFRGTGRRFEARGAVAGVRVVDDYAHHPTEVAAILRQARLAAGTGRVIALFQPHLYSRTRDFAGEFAAALTGAEHVVVTDVYGAREDPLPGVDGATITGRMPPGTAEFVADRIAAAGAVAAAARPGDLVLTIGAGDVTELGETILERLAERA